MIGERSNNFTSSVDTGGTGETRRSGGSSDETCDGHSVELTTGADGERHWRRRQKRSSRANNFSHKADIYRLFLKLSTSVPTPTTWNSPYAHSKELFTRFFLFICFVVLIFNFLFLLGKNHFWIFDGPFLSHPDACPPAIRLVQFVISRSNRMLPVFLM